MEERRKRKQRSGELRQGGRRRGNKKKAVTEASISSDVGRWENEKQEEGTEGQ